MTTPPVNCCQEPPPARPFDDDDLARIAKALAHPARLAILRSFNECRAHSAGEVVAGLALAQSTVSEHLRILREADLLSATPDPPHVWYCIRRSVLEQFAAQVQDLVDAEVHVAPWSVAEKARRIVTES